MADVPEGQGDLFPERPDLTPPKPEFKTVVVHEHLRKVRIRRGRKPKEKPPSDPPVV